ncbi:Protein psiI, partial [Frankliniella fusca]
MVPCVSRNRYTKGRKKNNPSSFKRCNQIYNPLSGIFTALYEICSPLPIIEIASSNSITTTHCIFFNYIQGGISAQGYLRT